MERHPFLCRILVIFHLAIEGGVFAAGLSVDPNPLLLGEIPGGIPCPLELTIRIAPERNVRVLKLTPHCGCTQIDSDAAIETLKISNKVVVSGKYTPKTGYRHQMTALDIYYEQDGEKKAVTVPIEATVMFSARAMPAKVGIRDVSSGIRAAKQSIYLFGDATKPVVFGKAYCDLRDFTVYSQPGVLRPERDTDRQSDRGGALLSFGLPNGGADVFPGRYHGVVTVPYFLVGTPLNPLEALFNASAGWNWRDLCAALVAAGELRNDSPAGRIWAGLDEQDHDLVKRLSTGKDSNTESGRIL